MAVVLIVAVALAALRRPTELWVSVIDTLAVIVVATAILGATASHEQARLMWLGSAIFGGIYAVVVFGVFREEPTLSILADELLDPWFETLTGIERQTISDHPPDIQERNYIRAAPGHYYRISRSIGVILATFCGCVPGAIMARTYRSSSLGHGSNLAKGDASGKAA